MSEIAENNQYWRGKIPIIEEYSKQHRALLSDVAGRAFCRAPGFLLETSLALEETGKNKLSALNFQIVSDAIERELKQTGHDYTEVYKAARIAFELEKQTLLTALQQEFADLDAIQNLSEEEFNRLFVELDIRKIILITTKTSIELQMETLKQELTDIERLTFTNEELLINEKIVTATAKLAVIPYLEALIESQEKILTAEEANLPHMENLIDEKELLVDKKLEVVPYLEEKAEILIELSEAMLSAIPIKEAILQIEIEKAITRGTIVQGKVSVINAESAVVGLRAALSSARLDLQSAKVSNRASILAATAIDIATIATSHASMVTQLTGDDSEIISGNENAHATIAGYRMSGQEQSTDITSEADKLSIAGIAGYNAGKIKEVADAQAAASITVQLIHLIGSGRHVPGNL